MADWITAIAAVLILVILLAALWVALKLAGALSDVIESARAALTDLRARFTPHGKENRK